jgi:outer membrane protein insertion porin family
MMFLNFEYLFPVIKAAKIRGLVFFDAGNAWAKEDSFSFDLRKAVGIGVNWLSPFGPLRVAWGLNLQPEFDEKRTQFEFSVGSGLGL